MNLQGIQDHFRGWFPQEPTLNILRSTSSNSEPTNASWASCPFSVPGALMIFAALLSANFGLTFVSLYFPGAVAQGGTFVAFQIGIFSVIAFVLGLICGGLLLANKRVQTSVAGIVAIFCLGLATIVIPIVEGSLWTSGLIVAFPMIAFPALALTQVELNTKKLKAYVTIQEPKPAIETEPQPINRKPVAAGLAAAGCGFILTGSWSYYLAPIWAKMLPGIIIVTGACLIVAAYLERRTYKQVV